MATTPENAVKKKIKAMLEKHKCYWYPAVAGPYSVSGIPDFVGCFKGQFFGIEAKAAGKKPTPLQVGQKVLIEKAGGKWFLVDSQESLNEVEMWLMGISLT